ncbi:hypothetical protein R50073_10880 [Maricurvus nonylphenolicus]|uniref:hypothetical protein n=1 Tax=Maricurvus nonylphenolicus TaxID=1008307 RepID=UPI0036F296A8
MKQLIFYVVFALATSHALAQEDKAEEKTSEQKQQETIEQAPPGDVKTSETFVPSEEVSEDLSVSFPIDI